MKTLDVNRHIEKSIKKHLKNQHNENKLHEGKTKSGNQNQLILILELPVTLLNVMNSSKMHHKNHKNYVNLERNS